jgi:hypothetical protein
MTDQPKNDRFKISLDEMHHRMELQQERQVDPCRMAVEIIERAIGEVMKSLGIDYDQPPEIIRQQQADLGLIITEETRDEMAGVQGFYFFLKRKGRDIEPYAWCGNAMLNSQGKCSVDIHWFQKNQMSEVGGEKLIG